jgi:CO/xanthine dehydrogenase FAD-binding subunit
MRLAAARPAFHRSRTLAEACELLAADERAMAYGGGTAIEVRRRQDPAFASAFVDLALIPGLDRLSGGDTGCASARWSRSGGWRPIRWSPVPRLAEFPITGTCADEAVTAAEALMDPVPDVRGSAAYKRALGRVAAQDAVRRAWQGAGHD